MVVTCDCVCSCGNTDAYYTYTDEEGEEWKMCCGCFHNQCGLRDAE